MTSTNVDAVNQAVTAFKKLPHTDDKLAVLALIYKQVASSLPANALSASPEVSEIVGQIEKMSHERQIDALRDILPAERSDQDEITLDPNPSKALTELATGGNTVPTGKYGSMKPESKLAFWYQVGQKLGSSFVGIPSDFSPSSEAQQLFQSLGSLETEQQLSFLTQII